jgi:ABC-2 type transport system ATP-binding protein
VIADGPRLHAQIAAAADGARALPGALAALEREGLAVARVSLSHPSLDDVYLNATGHAYHE